VIPPSEYEFDQAEWRAVMSLRHRIREGDISVDTLASAAGPTTDAIREEFDIPAPLSDPAAEDVLDDAVSSIADGEIDDADRLLTETFETPCDADEPTLRRTNAGRVACHLFDPAYQGEPTGEHAAGDD